MSSGYFQEKPRIQSSLSTIASPLPSPGIPLQKSNALQSRITSVLSASYADLEIRDSLETLDSRKTRNTPETRRNLRLEAQQELIECNAEVIRDFGEVAQVSTET